VTRDVFADWVGGLYQDPRVTIHNDEGRSFLRRQDQKFDIIQMSGVDTWSGLATGAYTLSENYLYTLDAFTDYLEHLKDDGVLSMIRYVFAPPRETLRLCSLGAEALKRVTGQTDISKHVVILSNHGAEVHPYASFLLKKSPFTDEELANLRAYAQQAGMSILHMPGEESVTKFHQFLTSADHEEFFRDYVYNIRPVTDDAPFFFKYYKWSRILSAPKGIGGNLGANLPIGHFVLLAVLVQALFFCTIFIGLPLLAFKRKDIHEQGAGSMALYFSCLGIGFMLVEMTLIQKLILFLGHPVYAVVVVLFSVLLATGVGSFIAGLAPDPAALLRYSLPGIAALSAFYAFFLHDIVTLFLGLPQYGRFAVAVVFIAPLGILLGTAFPSGLTLLHRSGRERLVPWAWGVNGSTSVIGSIGTVLLAMSFGFRTVMLIGAACYLVALWRVKALEGNLQEPPQ
jgi:hypothetical protein